MGAVKNRIRLDHCLYIKAMLKADVTGAFAETTSSIIGETV